MRGYGYMKIPSMPTHPLIQTRSEPPIDSAVTVDDARVTQPGNLRGASQSDIHLGGIQSTQILAPRVTAESGVGLIR